MGLFRPLDESIHDVVNKNAMTKYSNTYQLKKASEAGIKKGDGAYLQLQKFKNRSEESPAYKYKDTKGGMQRRLKARTTDSYGQSKYASGHVTESTAALLGLTDEDIYLF